MISSISPYHQVLIKASYKKDRGYENIILMPIILGNRRLPSDISVGLRDN